MRIKRNPDGSYTFRAFAPRGTHLAIALYKGEELLIFRGPERDAVKTKPLLPGKYKVFVYILKGTHLVSDDAVLYSNVQFCQKLQGGLTVPSFTTEVRA